MVRLMVQPGAGIGEIVKAIDHARKSVQLMIFRFDQKGIEQALTRAAERGIFVHALIAFTNRGGEAHLRKLESRLLAKGITVARTADDLVRYHAKYLIIDGRELHMLAFNFTHLDIERSRSFGVITTNEELVAEAGRLFQCDVKRMPYKAGSPHLVVSPANAREVLAGFIKGARKELLIYDPEVSDSELLRCLDERIAAGVKVRLIGKLCDKSKLEWRKLEGMRLHTRVMLRDGTSFFLGSQSLRKLELNSRREAGVIIRDPKAVAEMRRIFEKDWDSARTGKRPHRKDPKVPMKKTAKRVARVMANKLPVAPVVTHVVDVIRKDSNLNLRPKEVEDTVKEAVKDALKDAVKDAARKVVKSVVTEEAK